MADPTQGRYHHRVLRIQLGDEGAGEIKRYKKELAAFIDHALAQCYNGEATPQLVLISPTAIQDLSEHYHTPDGEAQNDLLEAYTAAMKEICQGKGVLFVDLFAPSKALFGVSAEPLTVDGAQWNREGYEWLAPILANGVFGKKEGKPADNQAVHAAVAEKNWTWHHLYKIPNGVHVYGRRYNPFGPKNYPDELKKLAEMTTIRDRAIWNALDGKTTNLASEDTKTHKLPPVQTNYRPSKKNGEARYLSGEDTLKHLKVPDGYKIELFADEKEFPDLANPCQMSFDNKGRLWVGCMPSYPHWRPGDPKPSDKLLIFEDTDHDDKADKQTVFADDLHLVIGFELAEEGVYVSQADSVILLTDTDGDDSYDMKEYLACGFDDHDTHHAISAFCADPSGAIYMGEGLFLHSNVETVYGTHRGTNGGFFRYNPKRRHLERTAQLKIPNPWGIAFDRWGQNFFLHTSGSRFNWMAPGTVKPGYGSNMNASRDLLSSNQVRPTSGLEIISSRHFPDEVQGDVLICNNIGFLGIKQHAMTDDGGGYKTKFRHDLLKSEEGNFRPVDLEFAPDGSLYVVDWSNVLIGHMQHNARDPNRDHVHGRVYRITYPSRQLLEPAKVAGASIAGLLQNLTLHEDRTRYRTRRELRGRKTEEVLAGVRKWIDSLDKKHGDYEHHLLEALWVTWGHDEIEVPLLRRLLHSRDYRIRAAATRAVRYNRHKLADAPDLLNAAASDPHARVRVEAITAASWLPSSDGASIVAAARAKGEDAWTKEPFRYAEVALKGAASAPPEEPKLRVPKHLAKSQAASFRRGHEIYHREGHCGTCHQENGKGLPVSGFPPLAKNFWAQGNEERLIKLTLNGLMGPIEVDGVKYPGQVPMTPFRGMLNDKEIADVLTYVRNSLGNKASVIQPDLVRQVRSATKDRPGFWSPEELLKLHPESK